MLLALRYAALLLSALLIGAVGFVFWPAWRTPVPAESACLSLRAGAGELVPLALDRDRIYAVALTYAGIIRQGGYDYDPKQAPPVFRKRAAALNMGGEVKYPSPDDIFGAIDALEPGLADQLRARFPEPPALLDYEVELGVVALEDIVVERLRDPAYAPKLGYFLANDLQSLTVGVLGAETDLRSAFLDQKGSFPGFMPVSGAMWAPTSQDPNSLLCVELRTHVNGELRQAANTRSRIYTNKEILAFVADAYDMAVIEAGAAVITGSPAGVALSTPRWKRRIGVLLRMDRFDKLSAIAAADRDEIRFLRPGDRVVISAEPFGSVATLITE